MSYKIIENGLWKDVLISNEHITRDMIKEAGYLPRYIVGIDSYDINQTSLENFYISTR